MTNTRSDAIGKFQPGNRPVNAFPKGVSPNPGGRRPATKELYALIEEARKQVPAAIRKIKHIMDNSTDERLQLEAACEILDRGLGKPKVAVDLDATMQSDQSIQVHTTYEIVDPDPQRFERLGAEAERRLLGRV